MSTPNTSSKLDDIDLIALLAETGLNATQVANAIVKAFDLNTMQSSGIAIDAMVTGGATKAEVSALNIPTNAQMGILLKLAGLLSTATQLDATVTDTTSNKNKLSGVDKADLDLIGLMAETGLTAAQVADAIKKSKELSKTATQINEALTKLDGVTKAQIDAAVANTGSTNLTTEQTEALTAAYNSKVAIEKINGLEHSASEIDGSVNRKQKTACSSIVLDYCDNLSLYTTNSGSAAANRELVYDDETGERVLKVTLNADGNHTIKKSLSIPNADIRKSNNFSVSLKIEDITKINRFTFIVYMTDGTYYQTYPDYSTTTAYNSYRDGKWFNFMFRFAEMAKSGTGAVNIEDSTADIDFMLFGPRVCTTGGVMYINKIVMGVRHKPKVSFSFDDGNISDYTVSKKILNIHNFKATTSIIGSLIGKTNFLTSDMIKKLFDFGWDIACHGNYSHYDILQNYDSIKSDILTNIEYIKNCGVPSPTIYIYPEGEYIPDSITAIEDLGFKAAGTIENTARPLPYINKMTFPRSGTSGKTLDMLKAEVDNLILIGGYKDFYTHLVATGATGNNTDTSIFKGLVEYISLKVDSGELEVMLTRDYFN